MKVRMQWTVLMALAAAVLLFLPARASAQSAQSLFNSKCAVCHGPDGSGSAVGKKMGVVNLRSEEVQKQTDAELIHEISNGVGHTMPSYKDKLSEAQIKELVDYLRTLVKKK